MAVTNQIWTGRATHPVHAVLLGGMIFLFLGAVLSDWAYSSTYQIQWKNFASWLNAGGLVLAGFALLWAAIESLRRDRAGDTRKWLHVGLIALTFLLGFFNALIHAKDAWASMPAGLILSVLVFLLAMAATWTGFSRRTGEPK